MNSVKSLPSFDVGKDFGEGKRDGKGIDGKGGFLSITHPNEAIFTEAETKVFKEHGFSNNQSILNLVKSTNKLKTPSAVVVDNAVVVSELIEVKNAIKSIKLDQNDVNYDVMENIIEYYHRRGNRATIKKRKL